MLALCWKLWYSELALESSFWVYRAQKSAGAPFSSPDYLSKAQTCLFYLKWWVKCPIELCEECNSLHFTHSGKSLESS